MNPKPLVAMKKKPDHLTAAERRERGVEQEHFPMLAELRRRAEAKVREERKHQQPAGGSQPAEADPLRALHELQVHQIELEMQNTELQAARDQLEKLLENYTDLYDFAPAGYFSLDEHGVILEVNLTGAALLGVERSRLLHRHWQHFVVKASQPVFLDFLKKVFAQPGKQVCEALLLNKGGTAFWADLQAVSAVVLDGPGKCCRMAVSDITALKRADEAQRRMEALALSNRELQAEIVRRHAVEAALKQSELHLSQSLEESRLSQEKLRHLARQLIEAQEAERKQISRELHDQVAQTLVGMNVHLESLAREATINPLRLKQRIVRTQKLVEKSVDLVHRFARDLRPTLLDDLGLIPALHSYLKEFAKRTKVRIHFKAFAGVERLSSHRRTVLYRVAQSALSNILQHAQATEVKVTITKDRKTARLEIHDNGKSFNVEQVLFAKRYKRLGLLGTRERVEMIGGTFSVESAPGQGTTIRAQIPFSHVRQPAKTAPGKTPA